MIRKASLLLAGVAFGAVVAVTLTQTHFFSGGPANAASADTYRELNLFGDVFERIRADYVESPDEAALIESAINGMLSGLDPHSSYLSPKHFKDMQVQTTGKFGGLGIEVTMEDGVIKVVSPIDDTPAHRAGVLANDLIIALDDEPIEGLTLNEAVERMRGPIKTPILLTIKRENVDKLLEIELVREEITIHSVRSREEDDVGYVRITTFNEQTYDGLKDAIDDLNEDIGEEDVKGYVIDLRNNPGGLLDQAIAVSDAFLDRGEIVSTRSRHAEETQRYNAHIGDLADGKPVIILVNGGSASASEIVAGALQDHRRATIIGSRSFGKGSVQTIIPLGANGALRLTTARYFTPSGRSIQAKGIDPDIDVAQDLPPELAEAAGEIEPRGEADLKGHLEGEDAAAGEEEESGSLAYVPLDPEEDDQLNYALDLLNGLQVNAEFPPDPSRGIPN
ncbi:MAG: S41 family peptidase [Hyphomicrobiales bacterium]|nr:S41 family peptidase [Hyphomicrobiales bacterium]